ncbi:hypothetical protein B9Z55_012102 [Caenorhabditis nigoni]|uniref:SCP domain-containing protein n=1 Tax=Caenorhabditis nigoni TaxID=1611254 RepID=A0A2G5TVP1_9PELO|nr:hypothetical protein B9Z55_012102 [Caenorhabditis nigoni]
MKGHFSIGILLLFCAYGALGGRGRLYVPDEDVKNTFVDEMNMWRHIHAQQANISNMHELSYDNDLENEIKTIDCDGFKGKDYIVRSSYMQKVSSDVREPGLTFGEGVKRIVDKYLPLFNPLETKVACVERKDWLDEKDCDQNLLSLCAVGPNKKPSKSDIKKGEPGSACTNGKTKLQLCKSGSSGSAGSQKDASGGKVSEKEAMEGQKEDNGSNHSSLIALLLIVFLI